MREQKTKRLFNWSPSGDWDPTTSIRKHANELKVCAKTMRRENKLYICLDLNPLNFAIWCVLENKTNATSHPNIWSFKTAIEKLWIKMSEEFILKSRRVHPDYSIVKIGPNAEKNLADSLPNTSEIPFSNAGVKDELKLVLSGFGIK